VVRQHKPRARKNEHRSATCDRQPRAGGVTPRGCVTRVQRKPQIYSRNSFVQHKSGAGVSLPWFAETHSQCHRAMTRNTTDARPATAIAMRFASPAATVSCMLAVSPLQTRFRTPRRADTRRSCLQARTCAGELATFAMHKRVYSQERGASPCRGWVTRVQRKSKIPSRRAFAQGKSGGASAPVVIHHARAAAIVGTTSAVSSGETMQWIPYCTRTDLLNGFLHSRRDRAMDCGLWATCSPNLSRTCQTMRGIAGCRASDCLAGFLHSRRDRAIDCGGHAGGYNGHQREQCADRLERCRLGGNAEHSADGAPARNVRGLSVSLGWAETARMARTVPHRGTCWACRQVSAGRRR
jgi:hypothetical protein